MRRHLLKRGVSKNMKVRFKNHQSSFSSILPQLTSPSPGSCEVSRAGHETEGSQVTWPRCSHAQYVRLEPRTQWASSPHPHPQHKNPSPLTFYTTFSSLFYLLVLVTILWCTSGITKHTTVKRTWVLVMALAQTSCVILGKSHPFSGPPYPSLWDVKGLMCDNLLRYKMHLCQKLNSLINEEALGYYDKV